MNEATSEIKRLAEAVQSVREKLISGNFSSSLWKEAESRINAFYDAADPKEILSIIECLEKAEAAAARVDELERDLAQARSDQVSAESMSADMALQLRAAKS